MHVFYEIDIDISSSENQKRKTNLHVKYKSSVINSSRDNE